MATISVLKKNIIKKFNHPFLEKYVGTPYIDIDKLWIVKQMTSDMDNPMKEQYIYATMLVQIALDTHDRVERENSVLEYDQAPRTTQLKVLAGDYYSGLYYYLLAMGENLDLIQVLARAIKEVNEKKIELYLTNYDDIKVFLKNFLKIDFLIFKKLASFLECSDVTELTFELLYFKRLKDEYTYLVNNNSSEIFERWLKHKNNISLKIYKKELGSFLNLYEQKLFKDRCSLKDSVSQIFSAICERENVSFVN